MKSISTDLPFRYRLDLRLVKRRGASREEEKLFPSIKKISRARSGSKISRYFRHIFEHKKIRRLLGSQIAILLAASSFVPVYAMPSSNNQSEEIITLRAEEIKISTETHIQYPVERVRINQGYYFFHRAVDFDGEAGDPVRSVMTGRVEMVQYSAHAYGNAILISHGNGFSSLYAHLTDIYVNEGDSVDMNTIIGTLGSTGKSTGPHLHLEIREYGAPINPFTMLP